MNSELAVCTKNLHLCYHVDQTSFIKRLVVAGADFTHTKDLTRMGGEFHQFLGQNKQGWVFGISQEAMIKDYIANGMTTNVNKTQKMHTIKKSDPNAVKSDVGKCKICQTPITLEQAIKSYTRHYAGGLPPKLASELLKKEYTQKLSVALGSDTFVCIACVRDSKGSLL